jgi:hypothetical protein
VAMGLHDSEIVPAYCSVWPTACGKPIYPACWLAPCFTCLRAVVPPCCTAGADAADDDRAGKLHTGVFSKDLPWLMYGCGDADKPLKVNGADRSMRQGKLSAGVNPNL